jgi:hypothetical protein
VRDFFVPGRDAAGIVYGTITMGALLAAERPRSETFPETVGAASLALALVWAAHTYAALLGHRLRGPDQPATVGADADGVDGTEVATATPQEQEPAKPAGAPGAQQLPFSAAEIRKLLRHELAVLRGGAIPLVALLLSWAAGASLDTAITATLWTCAGTLVVAELVAGLRAAAGPVALLVQVLAGGSLGVAVIALKVILR